MFPDVLKGLAVAEEMQDVVITGPHTVASTVDAMESEIDPTTASRTAAMAQRLRERASVDAEQVSDADPDDVPSPGPSPGPAPEAEGHGTD